jgi:hypothetical protein
MSRQSSKHCGAATPSTEMVVWRALASNAVILAVGVVLLTEVQVAEEYLILILVLLCVVMFPSH